MFNALDRDASFSNIAGGERNVIRLGGSYSTIGGGRGNTIEGGGTIGGGSFNFARGGTIAGGARNKIDLAANAAIAGGQQNEIGMNANESIIGGGHDNRIEYLGRESVIAGGGHNAIHTNAFSSTISGGAENHILFYANRSTIGGGAYNTISGVSGTIAGGMGNSNRGDYATIPGGLDNAALNDFTFAAGRRAKAHHRGAFVWGDSTEADIDSTTTNQFTVRASGGARFFANSSATVGVQLAPNGNSWSALSDRDAKKNLLPLDKKEVLEKLARIPVQRWHYKGESDTEVPHMGPMAQDFKAAFYPGRDDTRISTMEFDGVELAAIQGLNEKLEEEAKAKDAKIAALEKRLQELERLVNAIGQPIVSKSAN